jgi:hypothetical protein
MSNVAARGVNGDATAEALPTAPTGRLPHVVQTAPAAGLHCVYCKKTAVTSRPAWDGSTFGLCADCAPAHGRSLAAVVAAKAAALTLDAIRARVRDLVTELTDRYVAQFDDGRAPGVLDIDARNAAAAGLEDAAVADWAESDTRYRGEADALYNHRLGEWLGGDLDGAHAVLRAGRRRARRGHREGRHPDDEHAVQLQRGRRQGRHPRHPEGRPRCWQGGPRERRRAR